VEVWDGQHWRMFDPTPAAMRPGTGQSNVLKMYASALGDTITYYWDRYVLTYGLGDQILLAAEVITRARDMFGNVRDSVRNSMHAARRPIVLFTLLGIALLALVPIIMGSRRRSLFDLLAAHLRANGIHVGPAMTMEEALAELRVRNPKLAGELLPLITMYEAERFSATQDRSRQTLIRRRLSELKV